MFLLWHPQVGGAGPVLVQYSGVSFPRVTSYKGVSQPTVSPAGVVTIGVSAMRADNVIKAEFTIDGALP